LEAEVGAQQVAYRETIRNWLLTKSLSWLKQVLVVTKGPTFNWGPLVDFPILHRALLVSPVIWNSRSWEEIWGDILKQDLQFRAAHSDFQTGWESIEFRQNRRGSNSHPFAEGEQQQKMGFPQEEGVFQAKQRRVF